MAKYTVELRRLIEVFGKDTVKSWFSEWELSDYLSKRQLQTIQEAGIFNKAKLIDNIVDAYYMREIGYETAGLFRHYVKIGMREIMEKQSYYIYSVSLDYDPLVNENYTEDFKRKANGKNQGKLSDKGSNLTISSDTPQTNINKDDILKGNYATATSANEGNTQSNSESSNQEEEDYKRTVKGNRGVLSSAPYLVHQYRKQIYTIYSEIIKECDRFFLGVY